MSESLMKNEKLTLTLSVVAIVISILAPIANYLWLQSSVREQTLKKQGFNAIGWYKYSVNLDNQEKREIYFIDVTNNSKLPIDKVLLSYRLLGNTLTDDLKDKIETDPPTPFEVSIRQNTLFISLVNAMAPNQNVTVLFSLKTDEKHEENSVRHPYAWVSSEASPPVPITWQPSGSDYFGTY